MISCKFYEYDAINTYGYHYGLAKLPYGDTDPEQRWVRKWLVAWRHEAIT